MSSDDAYLEVLARMSVTPPRGPAAAATAALERLDAELDALAPRLAVECYGPPVGLDGAPEAYRLVIRRHEWRPNRPEWGLRVCDATPHCRWRAAWTVHGAGRLRRARILQALPALLAEYAAAVAAAGKGESPEGRRVREIAARLAAAGPAGQ